MPTPSSTIPFSLAIAGWWLPVLGLLLAGLGIMLVAVAVGDVVDPVRSARLIAGSMVVVEPISGRAVLMASVGRRAGTGAGAAIHLAPARLYRPTDCLGADLATGRRAESTHLATVALQMPGECGDLREALSVMATWDASLHATDSHPQPTTVAEAHQTDRVDLVAAALYGPPDRQPRAEEEVNGGRRRAHDYLEETAASRLRVPWSRTVE